jgi:hypothetical protein
VSLDEFEVTAYSDGLMVRDGISFVMLNDLCSKEELQIFLKKKCCVSSRIMASKRRGNKTYRYLSELGDMNFSLILHWNLSALHVWSIEQTHRCWSVIICMLCLIQMII